MVMRNSKGSSHEEHIINKIPMSKATTKMIMVVFNDPEVSFGVLVPDSRQWTVQEVLDVVMQDKHIYYKYGYKNGYKYQPVQ